MKTLYLFRHGETDWNRDGRMQGGTDVPLNENGRRQALRLREFFDSNPVEIFLSSDLSRARQTAEIAAGDCGAPIVVDARLRETNLGDAEGLTTAEFVARFGPEVMKEWRRFPDRPEARFPNGETKVEHLARTLAALNEFLRATPHARIGISTHGGSLRRLIHHLCPGDVVEPVMVGNCTAYRASYFEGSLEIDFEPVCFAD